MHTITTTTATTTDWAMSLSKPCQRQCLETFWLRLLANPFKWAVKTVVWVCFVSNCCILCFVAIPAICWRRPAATKGVCSAEGPRRAEIKVSVKWWRSAIRVHHDRAAGVREATLEQHVWSNVSLAVEAGQLSSRWPWTGWRLVVPCRTTTSGSVSQCGWYASWCCERNSAATCRYISEIISPI